MSDIIRVDQLAIEVLGVPTLPSSDPGGGGGGGGSGGGTGGPLGGGVYPLGQPNPSQDQFPIPQLKYADKVPDGAVNLAYVSALMDNPNSVIGLSDDLIDPAKYGGNSELTPGYTILNGPIYNLTTFRNQILDPESGVPWVANTDNVLFSSVATLFTDRYGITETIPLFYKQELRFPIPADQIPADLAAAIAGGIPLELTIRPDPTLPVIDTLATITTENGQPLPNGHLYQVMLNRLDNNGNLYIDIYTNFKSTYKHNFRVKWFTFNETLNVNPVYFQSLTKTEHNVYVATQALPTYITQQTVNISNSDNPVIVTSQRPTFKYSAMYVNSEVSQIDTTSNVPLASSLNSGSYTAGYYDNVDGFNGIAQFGSPNWEEYYFAHSTVYTTSTDTAAPIDAGSAISVNLNSINCAQTADGDGYVMVTILDPLGDQVLQTLVTNQPPRTVIVNGQPIVTGNPSAIYTSDGTYNATYYAPNAVAGEYTIYIGGLSDGSYNVYSNIQDGPYGQAGTFTFPVSWQGQYAWSNIQANNYSIVPGFAANYFTPLNTQAPSSTATELQLIFSGVNTPVSSFIAPSFTVTLTSPSSGVVYTQTGITAPTTVTYVGSGGQGSYMWSIWADGQSINPGIDQVDCTASGQYSYTLISNNPVKYVGKPGIASTYITPSNTIAPTGPDRAVELNLSAVSCPSSLQGYSSLEISLKDPSGKKVLDVSEVIEPQVFTYYDLAAINGAYTWSVIGEATASPVASSTDSFTDSWSGNILYTIPDQPNPTPPGYNLPVGFNFSTKITDGPFWATTDIGPQIYMAKPDNINVHENWYLRIHRGWLFFEEEDGTTHLVGLAPYYQQNFDNYIPIYKCNREKAEILSPTTIRVKNRPIFVNHNYPIDIIVTRTFINGTSQDIWVTRDNQKSSGQYLPQAISDIIGARGEIEISNLYLLASDSVHVIYDYLENFLIYTGFPDAFGRWLHLDLNPAGGHTYTNIWDSPSSLTPVFTAPASGTSMPSIQFTKQQSTTLQPDASAPVTISSSPTINLSTTSNGGPLYQTQTFNYASTGLVIIGAINGPQTTQAINASGIVNIDVHGNPSDSDPVSQTFNVTAAPISSGTQISLNVTTINYTLSGGPKGHPYPEVNMTLFDPNSNIIGTWNYLNNNGATPFNLPFTVTYYSSGATAGIYKLRTSAHPVQGGAPLPQHYKVYWQGDIGYCINPTITYESVNSPTIDFSTPVETSAPKTAATAVSLALNGLIRESDVNGGIKLNVSLYDPNGNQLVSNNYFNAPQVISYYKPSAIAGPYTWTLSGIVSNNNLSTAEYPISAFGYTSYYNKLFATGQIFNEKDGSTTVIPTSVDTAAPVDTNTLLTCKLSGVSVEDSVSGEAVWEVDLVDPNGSIVEQWTNLTKLSNLEYYDPKAIAGKYKWNIYPTAYILNNNFMTQNFGNEVITCQPSGPQKGWYQVASTTLTDTLTYDPTQEQLWATWISYVNGINGSGPTFGLGFWDANNNVVLASMVGTSSTGTIQFVPGTGPVYPARPNISLTGASTLASFVASNLNSASPNVNTMGVWPGNNPANWKLAVYNNNHQLYNGTINLPGTAILTPPFSPFIYSSTANTLYVRSYFINSTNPLVTNPSTYSFNTETFTCAASAVATWQDLVTQQSISYVDHDGKFIHYKTDKFTAAPLNENSQLTLKLKKVSTPRDNYGVSFITVNLTDPAGNQVGSWSNIRSPMTLTYSSSGTAISGQYVWSVGGQCDNDKLGISSYTVTWSGEYDWYEYASVATIGQNPSVELVNKGVYMYLTQTGYPFHAVLEIGDDPDRPLLYDTHGALDGTIYSTVPTIHSDL